jgi:hypothetical protein
VLFEYKGRELAILSKGFKTKDLAEKARQGSNGPEANCVDGPERSVNVQIWKLLSMARQRSYPWLLVALALMFTSAYSIARLFAAIASISALTGVPQYVREIPRSRAQAGWSETLAVVLPFFAALVLGLGKPTSAGSAESGVTASFTYPTESQAEKWTAPVVRYFIRLVISVLGTFGFLLCLLFIGFVFYKLRIHAG